MDESGIGLQEVTIVVEKERGEIKIDKLDLEKSMAFRVALDDAGVGPGLDQTGFINEMRAQGILSFPEDERTALGYLRTQDEMRKFVELAKKYPGVVGFGESYGDSRLWLVEDGEDKSVVATSTATNAAARAVYGGLVMRLGELDVNNLDVYRYTDIKEGENIVPGAKDTALERKTMKLEDLPESFDIDRESKVYKNLVESKLEYEEIVVEKAAVMAILSIDIRGFGDRIWEYTKSGDSKKADGYLETVVNLISLVNFNVKKMIQTQDPGAKLHKIESRGDSGGVIVDFGFADLLPQAYEMSLSQMGGEVAAKAVVLQMEDLKLKKYLGGVLTDPDFDKRVADCEKEMKEKMTETDSSALLNKCKGDILKMYGAEGNRESNK